MKKLKVGTRGSKLALWQADYLARVLKEAHPDLQVEIKIIKTVGDKILDVALSKVGDKGLFTKELEKALLAGDIDVAVHSMKDVPSQVGQGLHIAAVLTREFPQDALISHKGYQFHSLPHRAVIGTSSLRRAAQLKNRRPDLSIVDIRGNVETRLRKMQEQDLDAIVLAYAGLKRLGLENAVTELLDYDMMLPAAGQGAIAVESRIGDDITQSLLEAVDHEPTRIATTAERRFLQVLEGGCQVPIACLAQVEQGKLEVTGLVASLNGSRLLQAYQEGNPGNAARIGEELAMQLINQGANVILKEIRQAGGNHE
ncbi:hydroxymethylbilane synthase [Syntrophomonas erecta subsp. sporosyntropha]